MTHHTQDGGPLVIGVGNRYRRDDSVGLAVARHLRQRAGPPMSIVEASGEGARLLDTFERSSWVILIDAITSGTAPGTILRIDAAARPLSKRLFRYSTHAFSVAEAVELARSLGQLPSRFIIFGVEGADYEAGEGLSSAVDQAVARAAELILAEASLDGTPADGEG